jgi:hypothetical protein
MRLSRIDQHIKDEPCAKQRALLGSFSSRYSSRFSRYRSAWSIFTLLPLAQPTMPIVDFRKKILDEQVFWAQDLFTGCDNPGFRRRSVNTCTAVFILCRSLVTFRTFYGLDEYSCTGSPRVVTQRVHPRGGRRQNLFENYYFEKLHAPRARGARAAREGRRDESTVNNSGSKLKIRLTGELGNRMARLSRLFLGPGDNF